MTGVLADKEYEKMMRLVLPYVSKTAVITPENPRALESSKLASIAQKYCPDVLDAGNINDGIAWAKAEAQEDDVVIIFGSLSFMDEMKR